MKKITRTVSEVNALIRNLFEDQSLKNIAIIGELSEFKTSGGHAYFAIKDPNSTLKGVMWKNYLMALNFVPKVGDEVIIRGSINVYSERGTYQIYAEGMSLSGVGDKLLALKHLKDRLESKGYFRLEHKKPLKRFNEQIGLITALKSAAYEDLIFNIKRRMPLSKISFFPAQVQGKEAPAQLVSVLKRADKMNLDVIILSRGGGSLDDLEAFNDEAVVTAIYELNTPVVTAIGHEINLSLSDLVSDVHVSTPTAAAEIVTLDQIVLTKMLDEYSWFFEGRVSASFRHLKEHFESLNGKLLLSHQQMTRSRKGFIDKASMVLDQILEKKLTTYQYQMTTYGQKLETALGYHLKHKREQLKTLSHRLIDLSPENVLKRGYSLTLRADGAIIRDVNQIEIEDKIITKLHNHSIISIVKKKE
ncbi:MAG: exodeoxyribonuclease VII large subunit [Erysipelotrichaceae bacterium]|jgi:exodeoxyribonuclease VII large subunit|nr:exodeoxyribonuclease VII large subunit [Erysipelotrichaceae bacterium]